MTRLRAVVLGAVLPAVVVATSADAHLRTQGAWGGVSATSSSC
jgi:hypothetical protein